MSIDPEAYKQAAYPPPLRPPDLRDEDVSYLLDKSRRKRKSARLEGSSADVTQSRNDATQAKASEA